MQTSSEIWIAFARMFGTLAFVLVLIVLGFYLIKRFSTARGIKGGASLINVIAVHHLSPKEKLVLLKVVDDTILIGVTPQNISKISDIKSVPDLEVEGSPAMGSFSDYLARKIKQPFAPGSNDKAGSVSGSSAAAPGRIK